jgi:hypothetical protein
VTGRRGSNPRAVFALRRTIGLGPPEEAVSAPAPTSAPGADATPSPVVNFSSNEVRIGTASGSPQGLSRQAVPDYAAVYRVRLKERGEDATLAEVQARVFEAVVGFYLVDNPGFTVDEAALAVRAAINNGGAR